MVVLLLILLDNISKLDFENNNKSLEKMLKHLTKKENTEIRAISIFKIITPESVPIH